MSLKDKQRFQSQADESSVDDRLIVKKTFYLPLLKLASLLGGKPLPGALIYLDRDTDPRPAVHIGNQQWKTLSFQSETEVILSDDSTYFTI